MLKEITPPNLSDIDPPADHQTEKKRPNTEALSAVIIRATRDAIITMDHEGKICLWNPAAEKIFGWSREEAIGKSAHELLAPERFRPAYTKGLSAFQSTGTGSAIGKTLELSATHKDGHEFPIELSLSSINIGDEIGAVGVVRDLSERKNAENALQEKTEQLNKMFENANIGIVVTGTDGQLIKVNPTLCKMLGYEFQELKKKTFQEITHPEDLQKSTEFLKQLISGEIDQFSQEKRYIHKNGSVLWVLINVSAVRDADKKALYFVNHIQDITERKRLEDGLRDQSRFVDTVINSLNSPLYVIDRNFRVVLGNKAAKEKGIVDGGHCYQLTHQSEKPCEGDHLCPLKGVVRSGKSVVTDHIHIDKDGKARNYEVHGDPIFDENGQVAQMIEYSIDITNRKQAEQELHHKTALLEAQAESTIDGILIVDRQGKKTFQNRRTVELWKIPQHIAENPDDTQQVQHVMHSTKNPDQFVERVSYLYSHPNETTRDEVELMDGTTLDRYSAPILSKDGQNFGRIWTFRDITERKKAEEKLKKSETLYSTLFGQAIDGIVLADESGEIIKCNQAMATMVDRKVEDLIGQPQAILHPRPDPNDLSPTPSFKKHLVTNDGSILETQIITKEGVIRDVEIKAKRLILEGRVILQGIFRDITDRKRAEQALGESEERHRNLFENSHDSLMTLEPPSWNFTSGNPATLAMFGAKSQEEFEACAPWELSPEFQPDGQRSAEKAKEMIGISVREGSHFFEWTHKRLNGEEFPATVLLTPMEIHGKTVVQATVRDITGQKRAEIEKEDLQKQLYQAQKMEAIGTLAGGIAHDFNNTLAVIIGSASFGLEQTQLSDPSNELFREIQNAVSHAAALTRKLLALSRRQLLREEVIFPQERIFPGLEKMLSRIIGEDIRLEFQVEKDLDLIKIDPDQLTQSILNLVINARDAIEEKKRILKFEGAITISARNCELSGKDVALMPELRPGPHVQISVEDNGCGIPEGSLQKIFTPFFTTKEVGKGTGLGLASILGVVGQSHGGIQVESKVSEGAHFTLYFPKHEGAAPAASLPPEKKEAPDSPKTILLVEDDEQVNRMLKRQLEKLGHTVIATKNPKEALSFFKENGQAIHLIVSDMKMPHMSGPEMMELIRAIKQVPVLFISGYPKEHFEEANKIKDEFLMKPFSPEEMAEKIRKIFEIKKPEEEKSKTGT